MNIKSRWLIICVLACLLTTPAGSVAAQAPAAPPATSEQGLAERSTAESPATARASTVDHVIYLPLIRKSATYQSMGVGFIQSGTKEGGWVAANSASFTKTAQSLGILLKFHDSQEDVNNQLQAFHQFNLDPEVSVIVLRAIDSTGWDEMLNEAKAHGKVVVLDDRSIDSSVDLYATRVSSDLVEEGRRAAREMCRLLDGSAHKNVVELVGAVGAAAATDRGSGFREAMTDCGITITQSQTANWNAADGQTVMADFLATSQDIQGVFAQNDEMGFGAIDAIKAAGLKPGIDIKIVSVDAVYHAFEEMIAGELNVTIECNPLLAPQVYDAALRALNGETLPKWIPSQEGIYRQDTAATDILTRQY